MRVLSALLMSFACTAFSQVLFQDDFDDGDADGWHEISQIQYDVIDGMYRMYGGYEENHGISFNGDSLGFMTVSDYSVRLRIVPQTGIFFGTLIRFSEANPYNVMIVLSLEHQAMSIYTWNWSSIQLLESQPFAVQPEMEYWIRCEAEDDQYRGKAWTGQPDDEPDQWLVSAMDTLSSPGSVALWCVGIQADVSLSCLFDDVQVTALTSSTQSATWAFLKSVFSQQGE